MLVRFLEPVGQAHHAVFELRALQIARTVERRPFSGGELADAFHDRFDHVGLGRGEAFALRKLLYSGVDADGEQLILSGGRIGHG